jgi:hypothetical protein
VLAPHPTGGGPDAFWIAGGRLADWGELPTPIDELCARTSAAIARGGRRGEFGAHVPPNEVDEVRIVAGWLHAHPEVPQLALHPPPEPAALARFAATHAQAGGNANGSSTTVAEAA